MSDHVIEVDVVTSDGARMTSSAGGLNATDLTVQRLVHSPDPYL